MNTQPNPYAPPETNTATAQQPVPYFKAWILFFLLVTFAGGIVGMVFRVAVGVVLGAAGKSPQEIAIICGLLGFLLGIPINFLGFYFCVKRFIVQPLMTQISGV